MNKIPERFDILKNNGQKALIAYVTGGDPDMETTEKLILAMAEEGVDIIEIGIPFSDPVAEGVEIQAAHERSLANGCTADKIFDMITKVRSKTNIPLLFMTYMNPVFTYGKEKFMSKCKETGIDGVIIPDLPFEEKDEIENECKKYDISLISLIAPTSQERIEKISKDANGFLYCISLPGVENSGLPGLSELISEIKKNSPLPCLIGLENSDFEQAKETAKISDGIIISELLVKTVAEFGKESIESVRKIVKDFKESIK